MWSPKRLENWLPMPFFLFQQEPFIDGIPLSVLSNASLWNGMMQAKWRCLPSLSIQLWSGTLFHCVTDVSYVDTRAFPELVLFMNSCLTVDLFWGMEARSPTLSFWLGHLFMENLLCSGLHFMSIHMKQVSSHIRPILKGLYKDLFPGLLVVWFPIVFF